MNSEIEHALNSGSETIELSVGQQRILLNRIPSGSFQLGSPSTEKGHRDVEAPQRKVDISRPFYIGRYEITQSQYIAVVGSCPSSFSGSDLAVDQITYTRAREFCEKLSTLVNQQVTLPTEAQWEYACRAGTTTRFYTGDSTDDLMQAAWFEENSNESIHPVGLKSPNAFGLFDMLGNVWELCLDVLPDYSTISAIDPVGEISDRGGTMRGGAWMYDADFCRAACGLRTNDKFGGCGIRVVINLQ